MPTLTPPVPSGFRGVQPIPAGTDAPSRGVPSPISTPEPFVPTWKVIYSDDFNNVSEMSTRSEDMRPWPGDFDQRIVVEDENGFVLLKVPDTEIALKTAAMPDVRLEARIRLLSGSVTLAIRNSVAGAYRASFSTEGEFTLSRADNRVLASAKFNPVDGWAILSLVAIGDQIWVFMDEVELATAVDRDPLPVGSAYIATGHGETDISLDDVRFDGIVDLNETVPSATTRSDPDLNCSDMTGYDWCAPIDFRINFYSFGQGPRTETIGYHGPSSYTQSGYSRWYRGSGNRSWENWSYSVRKIVVLYDYTPGQTYGAACSPNYVYLVDRYGAGAQTVANFNSLSAGADQVVEWTGVDTLYDGMRFHYQHACTYRIPWLTPNPAGAMTVKRVVLYGVGASPLQQPYPPTSTPTPSATPTATQTPTSTPTPSCATQGCTLNGSAALPAPESWSSEEGVYVPALETTIYGNGTCNGTGDDSDRLDCADAVYDSYYSNFDGTPTYLDALAAVFDEELGSETAAFGAAVEPAVEAFANNYLSACATTCSKDRFVWWLSSKQGWYKFAGQSVTQLIDINRDDYSTTAAARVFSDVWTGGYGNGNIPFDWANWGYSYSGYSEIRSGTQAVEHKSLYQRWDDFHGYEAPSTPDGRARCNNGTANGNTPVPKDFWTDYVFAIVTHNQDATLAAPSTYDDCVSTRVNWLPANEADAVSGSYSPGTYNHSPWP